MLGSRKLLIVLCIVPCLLSLVCIGAFAAPAEDVTPSVDLPLETEVVEDVVKSPSALAEETFPAVPLLESSYYSYSVPLYRIPAESASAISVSSFSYSVGGSYRCGGSGDVSPLYRSYNSTSHRYYINFAGTNYYVGDDWDSISNGTVVLLSPSSSLTFNGDVVISGTLVEESLVPELADSVFSLGDAFITFMVSSWVVLVPLAAWLVILCIGAIRKLVKGV